MAKAALKDQRITSISRSIQDLHSKVTVKPVTSEEGFLQCQNILIEVWDLEKGGQRNIVPVRLFRISQLYGGVVLGACMREDKIIGFAWAFPALDGENKLFLFSDTLAVLPRYRDQGIGYALKFRQRKWALSHNITLIRWTYDPLEARNGYLNIARLGSVACMYRRNAYGVGTSGPNKGIETDRLVADWHLDSNRVKMCVCTRRNTSLPAGLPMCILADDCDGDIIPKEVRLDLEEPELLLPVPINFQRLKEKNLDLAKEWRLASRRVFETYFARGYAVVDFNVGCREQERRGYYRLSRHWLDCLHSV